jgi:hypothetical protein
MTAAAAVLHSAKLPVGQTIADDFNRATLGGDWTVEAGDWSIISNELDETVGGVSNLRYTATDTDTSAQFIKVRVVTAPSTRQWHFIFRAASGTNAGLHYRIDTVAVANAIRWRVYNNNTFQGNVSANATFTHGPGDWVGFIVEGSGDGTTIKAWRWASDPDNGGPARLANWGAPAVTFTDNPGGLAVDEGHTVGVGAFGNAGSAQLDDFAAGDLSQLAGAVIDANASVTFGAAATLAGTGAMAAAAAVNHAAQVTLAGTGSLTATGSFRRDASATLAGAATLSVTPLVHRAQELGFPGRGLKGELKRGLFPFRKDLSHFHRGLVFLVPFWWNHGQTSWGVGNEWDIVRGFGNGGEVSRFSSASYPPRGNDPANPNNSPGGLPFGQPQLVGNQGLAFPGGSDLTLGVATAIEWSAVDRSGSSPVDYFNGDRTNWTLAFIWTDHVGAADTSQRGLLTLSRTNAIQGSDGQDFFTQADIPGGDLATLRWEARGAKVSVLNTTFRRQQRHVFVVVADRTAQRRLVYVDGRLGGTGTATSATDFPDGPTFINLGCKPGLANTVPNLAATGYMELLAIWNRVLSQDEITQWSARPYDFIEPAPPAGLPFVAPPAPDPCDWFDSSTGAAWAQAEAQQTWAQSAGAPTWVQAAPTSDWAQPASGEDWATQKDCD